jgi:hypothetical protein
VIGVWLSSCPLAVKLRLMVSMSLCAVRSCDEITNTASVTVEPQPASSAIRSSLTAFP